MRYHPARKKEKGFLKRIFNEQDCAPGGWPWKIGDILHKRATNGLFIPSNKVKKHGRFMT